MIFVKNMQDWQGQGEGQLVNRETTNLRKRLSIQMFGVSYRCVRNDFPRPRHGTCFSLTQQHDSGLPSKTNLATSNSSAGGVIMRTQVRLLRPATLDSSQLQVTCPLPKEIAHVSCEGSRNPIRTARRKDFLLVNVELSERGVRKDG